MHLYHNSLKIRLLPLACFSNVLCACSIAAFSASDTGLTSTFFNCINLSDKPSFCVLRASTVEGKSSAEVMLESRLTSVLRGRSADAQSAILVRWSAMVLSSCVGSSIEVSSAGSWRQ